jgi:drug/metabolite transporter (DMT)-like permease
MSTMNKRERAGAGLAGGSVLLIGGSVAASSLLSGYPVLGGQAIRYLAAGLALAIWARLRHQPLPRPAGREWAWLAALAAVGLAGCSVLMIEATRVANPASVGIMIGAAPLVIIVAAAIAAGRRPTRRVLLAAAVVAAGSAAAQLGGATGPAWSAAGLLWSAGALGGAVGTSLLAVPLLPRLGPLAVTVYACGLAGAMLLAAAVVARSAGGPPILRMPTVPQLAALAYLTIAVTILVFLAWYGAMERLGVDRTGLFNGLIPVTSLAAVALTGTGSITPPRLLGAFAVLAGVILGLLRPGAGERGDVGGEAVQARLESGLSLGSGEHRGHVGLVGDDLRGAVAEVGERDRRRHAALDAGLLPHEPLRPPYLDVDGAHRVLAAVTVVDHGGLEHTSGPQVNGDPADAGGGTRRSPETREMLRLGHAVE